MFCKNCGRQIPDNAAFCPACGTKRSGGDSFGDAKSGRDIKNLPDYAKENDLNRSGDAIDTNRKDFSLADSGKKKFSLADSGQKKFTLSGSGQKKFSLSGKDKDPGDGIVRISANREPAPPPKSPTGFVNPLKDSGKTVFHDEPAEPQNAPSAPEVKPAPEMRPAPDVRSYTPRPDAAPEVKPAPEMKPYAPRPAAEPPREPASEQAAQTAQAVFDVGDGAAENTPDGQFMDESGGRTGFVNPLKDSGQDIRWGSDGDRNEAQNVEAVGDPEEIDSHMAFSIFTLLCCCQPTSILAIIFSFMVNQEVKKGNYEQARKFSNLAKIFCWISIVLSLFCGGVSSIVDSEKWNINLPASSSVDEDEEESESRTDYESDSPAPDKPANKPAGNR